MAKSKRSKPTAVKATESQVALWLAQIFGVAPLEGVRAVADSIFEEHGMRCPMFADDLVEMYPWLSDVPGSVMGDESDDFIAEVACSPGVRWVVRDPSMTGRHSLWMVESTRGSFTNSGVFQGLPVRMLVNHFMLGDTLVSVRAVQLVTCLRYGD